MASAKALTSAGLIWSSSWPTRSRNGRTSSLVPSMIFSMGGRADLYCSKRWRADKATRPGIYPEGVTAHSQGVAQRTLGRIHTGLVYAEGVVANNTRASL